MLHSALGRPGDRVEPDLRVEVVLVDPRLAAVVERDDARRAILQRRGQAALEAVRGFDEVIVDRDDRVVADARLGLGQERRGHRAADSLVQKRSRYARELVGVGDAPDDDVVDALEQHREHRARVALRVVGVDVAREQIDERRERVAQLGVVLLGEPPVLAHEHARVADRARQREHVEELEHVRAQRVADRCASPMRSASTSAPMRLSSASSARSRSSLLRKHA